MCCLQFLADFKMMDLLIIHFLITIIVEAKSKNEDTESEQNPNHSVIEKGGDPCAASKK